MRISQIPTSLVMSDYKIANLKCFSRSTHNDLYFAEYVFTYAHIH